MVVVVVIVYVLDVEVLDDGHVSQSSTHTAEVCAPTIKSVHEDTSSSAQPSGSLSAPLHSGVVVVTVVTVVVVVGHESHRSGHVARRAAPVTGFSHRSVFSILQAFGSGLPLHTSVVLVVLVVIVSVAVAVVSVAVLTVMEVVVIDTEVTETEVVDERVVTELTVVLLCVLVVVDPVMVVAEVVVVAVLVVVTVVAVAEDVVSVGQESHSNGQRALTELPMILS